MRLRASLVVTPVRRNPFYKEEFAAHVTTQNEDMRLADQPHELIPKKKDAHMNLETARQVAEKFLEKKAHNLIISDDKTIEMSFGWVFYTIAKYPNQVPIPGPVSGAGPMIVDRLDKSVHFLGSNRPQEAVDNYEKDWMQRNGGKSAIPVSKTIRVSARSPGKLIVSIHFFNASPHDVFVLKEFPSLFVTTDGEDIDYTGPSEKRKAYTLDDYERVKPGKSTEREENIASLFAWKPGTHVYEVSISGDYADPTDHRAWKSVRISGKFNWTR